MRPLLYILSFLISFSCWAQPKLGMQPSYTLSPGSATTTAVGIAYNGSITVSCYVKNKSNAAFGGLLQVQRQVKTAGFQSGVSTVFSSSLGINPNDSLLINFTDTITPSSYKVNGNGNTIVVWPVSAGTMTMDSLTTAPIYVNDPTGMPELDRRPLMIYPNPVSRRLYIKPQEGRTYTELMIYDLQMKELRRQPFEDGADLGSLERGIYILTVSDSEGRLYSTRLTKAD